MCDVHRGLFIVQYVKPNHKPYLARTWKQERATTGESFKLEINLNLATRSVSIVAYFINIVLCHKLYLAHLIYNIRTSTHAHTHVCTHMHTLTHNTNKQGGSFVGLILVNGHKIPFMVSLMSKKTCV